MSEPTTTTTPPPPPVPASPSSAPPLAPLAPPSRWSRPASEALLNEKWDHCLSSLLIRSGLGLSFGVIFSVLIFRRRAWPAWVGLGFGAGRAWEECDSGFRRGGAGYYTVDGLRVGK
ncbi:MAG: Mitochondrial inner membrane organizing system component [Phylliscum demangeonii]|nr:MAG: Mitochondrial inner membrane organizing system component [Phylliscum demangeonii]